VSVVTTDEGRSAIRARARIVAERGARPGAPRFTSLRSEPPLTLRRTPDAIYVVGSSAGPLTGDDLRLDVTVGTGTALTIRSAAAVLAQPGVVDGPSRLSNHLTLGAGASLRWLPEPTVLVQGCDHEARTRIHLAGDARLLWRDEVVLGRHGEPPGSLWQRLSIDVVDGDDAGPLLRNDLTVGDRWPGAAGPAGIGDGTGAVGSVLVRTPGAPRAAAGHWMHARTGDVLGEVFELDDRTALLSVLGPAGAVNRCIDRFVHLADVT
jgi:urease accessory protein